MPSLRPWRDAMLAGFALLAAFACFAATAGAHDFERTRVTLTFARDGSFVLDVTNDAAWLPHRLIAFRHCDPRGTPSCADRVMLFIDGREVRPESVEMLANV